MIDWNLEIGKVLSEFGVEVNYPLALAIYFDETYQMHGNGD